MANSIRIKHGQEIPKFIPATPDQPAKTALQPYELGFCDQNNTLYIGLEGVDSQGNPMINCLPLTNPTPADYIIEEGKKDTWNYRKWKSGKAECWTTHAVFSGPHPDETKWGESRIYQMQLEGSVLPFPSNFFTTVPLLFVSYQPWENTGGDIDGFLCADSFNGKINKNTTGAYKILLGKNRLNTQEIYLNYYAIGQWK